MFAMLFQKHANEWFFITEPVPRFGGKGKYFNGAISRGTDVINLIYMFRSGCHTAIRVNIPQLDNSLSFYFQPNNFRTNS